MVCGGADVTVMARLSFTEQMYFIAFLDPGLCLMEVLRLINI